MPVQIVKPLFPVHGPFISEQKDNLNHIVTFFSGIPENGTLDL